MFPTARLASSETLAATPSNLLRASLTESEQCSQVIPAIYSSCSAIYLPPGDSLTVDGKPALVVASVIWANSTLPGS